MRTTLRPEAKPKRSERAFEAAVTAFLWAFRIFLLVIVVVGSFLTLSAGTYSIDRWVDLIVDGAVQGGIYALVALGYTMVYGIMRMINFAHGEIFMIGIFSGYFVATFLDDIGLLNANVFTTVLSMLVMMLVAAGVSTLVALAVERVAYRPLRNSPRLVLLISAIGASFFLQYTMAGLFGTGIYTYPRIDILLQPIQLPLIDGLGLRWIDVVVIGSALAMMTVLYAFVMRSNLGTAIRAVSEDKEAAALMGIDVNRAIVWTFGVGAAMAGAAGVLYGLVWVQVQFITGFVPGIKAFTAAVLGGIGNIPGAMVGGFVLGEAESVGALLFLDGLGVPSPSQLKDVIAFTILVMVLMFRPQGILGERLSGLGHDLRRALGPMSRDLAAWRPVLVTGLLFGGVALYITLVGIVGTFQERNLIKGDEGSIITVGEALLLLTAIVAGYVGAKRAPEGLTNAIIGSAVVGVMSGSALSLLILLGSVVDLRAYLPNASPKLEDLLTLGLGAAGFWVPLVVGVGLGALGGIIALLPRTARALLVASVGVLVFMGLFSSTLRSAMIRQEPLEELGRELLASNGLTVSGALVVLGIVALVYLAHIFFRPVQRVRALPPETKRHPAVVIPASALLLLIVLLIPLGFVGFVPQVVALIALYVLMGLGLNITLGMAGLLDLGFVAFFAVGAYTVGLLTSTGEFGIAQWPFWAAIPFAIIVAMAFGVILGLPILGIRGDYLAIATLAFGEIIRLMVGSELLKPWLGGPNGFLNIPKPVEVDPGHFLAGANSVYYVALACAAVIAFVALRLRGSRLGRAWIAIREDEDVAEALGINLIQTKSLAYMLGAAFAGLGGAVFASLVGSILPSSIRLDISIQVVSLIIIGGMGSIPGVVLGAIFLVGVPELFREFNQYRFLFYGIALIVVMRFRPEGLMPTRVGRQETRRDENLPEGEPPAGPPTGAMAEEPAARQA